MPITYPALPGQNIIQQVAGTTTNGYTQGVNLVKGPQNSGVPIQTHYTFKAIPATPSATSIAQASTLVNLSVVLNTVQLPSASPALGTFIVSTPMTYLGNNCIVLDMERIVLLTFGSAPTSGVVVTMTGYDYRGVKVIQQITLTGATAQTMPNPVAIVQSIVFSSSPGSMTVSAGTNNGIGLPYYLYRMSHITSYWWNGAPVTPVQGTNIITANGWRVAGYTPINVATASAACRGYLALPTNPTSAQMFSFSYFVEGEDSEVNGQLANLNQSALEISGIQVNATGDAWVMPTLLPYDALGVQYPGDLDFATRYYDQLAL